MEQEKIIEEALQEKLIAAEIKLVTHDQLFNKLGQTFTDLILRITSLERILISKGIFTESEYEKVLGIATGEMNELLDNSMKDEE